MKFINIYLVGYFVLVVGAMLALWQAGILARLSPTWVVIGLIIAARPRHHDGRLRGQAGYHGRIVADSALQPAQPPTRAHAPLAVTT